MPFCPRFFRSFPAFLLSAVYSLCKSNCVNREEDEKRRKKKATNLFFWMWEVKIKSTKTKRLA